MNETRYGSRLAYALAEAAEGAGQKVSTLRRAINTTDGSVPQLRAKRGPRGAYIILRRDLETWLQQLPDA